MGGGGGGVGGGGVGGFTLSGEATLQTLFFPLSEKESLTLNQR